MNTKTLGIIFAVAECVGVGVTAYCADRCSKKATLAVINNNVESAFNEEGKYDMTKEDVKTLRRKNTLTVAKSHIPTFIAGGLTCGLIIFSTSKHIKTEKNLLAAAMMSQTLLERYEKQVLERTDPELAAKIREEVIGEAMECELDDIHESYSSPEARMRIKDPYTGTIYYASQTELLLGEIELNKCLMNGGGMSLKEWLERFEHGPIKTNLIDPATIGWYMDDEYSWDSSYFGLHCACYPYWDKGDDYCIAFSHDPMTPSEDLC